MASKENSNNFQSDSPTSYRFGPFELQPAERLFRRSGETVQLTPRAFDVLLYLVRRAERLVTKRELMDALWPGIWVTEANLTNAVVALRRVLGPDAIQTVSKHGYRLTMPVEGEPGVSHALYQTFTRANELLTHRSIESVTNARELYWLCLAQDPSFAPAWAWLGRCAWFRGKFGQNRGNDPELADAAFRRAFTLDPDLACAHQFYTPVQADMGHARRAVSRLAQRLTRHPDEPETLAGLTQVLRFCGLLQESVDAARRAMDLQPSIGTSLPHTQFLLGNFAATIEAYGGGKSGYYLDAAAWAAIGEKRHAASLLRERLGSSRLSPQMAGLMESLLAVAEDRFNDSFAAIERVNVIHEPEITVYLARHCSWIGRTDAAIRLMRRAQAEGFVWATSTLRDDPWLEAVRSAPEFQSMLEESDRLAKEARSDLGGVLSLLRAQ